MHSKAVASKARGPESTGGSRPVGASIWAFVSLGLLAMSQLASIQQYPGMPGSLGQQVDPDSLYFASTAAVLSVVFMSVALALIWPLRGMRYFVLALLGVAAVVTADLLLIYVLTPDLINYNHA